MWRFFYAPFSGGNAEMTLRNNSIGKDCSFLTFVFLWFLIPTTWIEAQVFQWEYVDPSDPSQGKQRSNQFTQDGASANLSIFNGLRGYDLTKAYLFQANIQGYRLGSTILNDAYLAEANMESVSGNGLAAQGADMSYGNLRFARLETADLTGTRFKGADLTSASLSHATLTNADFTDAIITDTSFNGTTDSGFTSAQLYQSASYKNQELGALELTGNDLSGWDFSNQQMKRASFWNTDLTDATFSDAIVSHVDFTRSNLTNIQLYSTASYKNGQLEDTMFSEMDLSGWVFSGQSLERARIQSSELSGANFDNADMSSAHIGSSFDVQFDVSFQGANLSNSTFNANFRWERADFSGANLEGAQLSNNGFVNSSFDNAIIRGAELNSVFNLGFTLANLYSTASYQDGDLTNIEIQFGDLTGADFRGINLSGSNLSRMTLDGADFQNAVVVDGRIGASLDGADFRGANLTNTLLNYDPVSSIDFRGANLTKASFEGTSLVNADLTDAVVYGTRLSVENSPQDLTKEQLYSTASYKSGMLGPITLAGDMQGWDFGNQDLSGARFERDSNLEGALWDGATLNSTLFFVNALSNTDFRQADVRQVMFISSNLLGADFRSTDLTDAEFRESSVVGAHFEGTVLFSALFLHSNLDDADFTNSNLEGARFAFINSFSGTNFSGANIKNASFAYATDAGFTLEQLRSTKSFQERDLSGIDFEGSTFPGADFSGMNLSGVDFNRADLTDADFSYSNLTGVNFDRAIFSGADLTNTIIRRANFRFANSPSAQAVSLTRDIFESTTSFKNRRLDGINLSSNDLRKWDFSGQDLREAVFRDSLLGAAIFDLADLRGAMLYTDLTGLDFTRTIMPDGTLSRLRIDQGEVLTIRSAPELISLEEPPQQPPRAIAPEAAIAPFIKLPDHIATIDGTLEILLDDLEWESTLAFDPRASVNISGTLRLDFDELTNPISSVGRTFDLFNWPLIVNGTFDIVTHPKHTWDLSNLYSTGEVRLLAIPEPSSLTGLTACMLSILLNRTRDRREVS